MKENKSIRIRTNLNQDKYITCHLEQTFDTLDILSLKLRQEDVYRSMCSDYGMICGRVSTKDFGIPNAKISVFIPLSEGDENNQLISILYPYKRTSDKDERGIRYNLLPKDKRNTIHQPVGTFFSKREILDNDLVLEIYEKYYKFSTITNSAGDYMIMGIPVGTHTIHMDIDFSDIGFVSSRPYELIEKGYDENLFENKNKFKRSTNLDELAQIVSQNRSVEILPFWGNLEQCEVGITRTDFDIQNFEITPSCIFFGSMYADHGNNYIDATGLVKQPNAHIWGDGEACYLHPDPGFGKVFIITKLEDGSVVSLPTQDFGTEANWGDWAFSILMNKSKKITDEFGNQIISSDPSKGIPTEIDVRFKIRFEKGPSNWSGSLTDRKFANYLVPNMTNNFKTDNTGEFYTMKLKRIYTVRQYIPRYHGNSSLKQIRRFLGIQRGNECPWSKEFPYNRVSSDLTGVKNSERYHIATDTNSGNGADLIKHNLTDPDIAGYDSYSHERSYDFYNNWINGSLYSFIWQSNPLFFKFPNYHGPRYIVDKPEFSEDNNNSCYTSLNGFINWLPDPDSWYASHAYLQPDILFFATNITDLGSSSENPGEFGIPDAPFLFDKLPYSSYKLPGNANIGFFETIVDGHVPGVNGENIINPEEITRTCEIGQQITIANDLTIIETFDDPLRKWLSENNGGGNYNNHKGDLMKSFYNPNYNSKFSYYFYFGMTGGISNSLDLVKKKFFS